MGCIYVRPGVNPSRSTQATSYECFLFNTKPATTEFFPSLLLSSFTPPCQSSHTLHYQYSTQYITAGDVPIMAPEMELDPKYDHYDFPTTSPEVQTGHPGHTTPEQNAQVFQLRSQLEQAGYTERLDTLTMVRYAYQPTTIKALPLIHDIAPVSTSTQIRCCGCKGDVSRKLKFSKDTRLISYQVHQMRGKAEKLRCR